MSKRSIVVDGTTYLWTPGNVGVVVWTPDKKQHQAPLREVTGLDWYAFERGQWKRTTDGMIRPGQVAAWIKTHLT